MTTEITTTPTTESGAAPKKVRASKKTAKPAAQKATKPAATKKRAAKPAASKKAARPKSEARADSKKAIILELLRRKQGATLAEIAKATDWQNHSIRGFISGQLTKKMGLTVESSKSDAGDRTYRITK